MYVYVRARSEESRKLTLARLALSPPTKHALLRVAGFAARVVALGAGMWLLLLLIALVLLPRPRVNPRWLFEEFD